MPKAEMTSDNRSSVVRRLLPRHFKILEMVYAGHTNKVIAETFNMHHDTISALTRSPLFQAELVRRRKEDPLSDMMGLDRDAVLGKARSILEQAVGPAAYKMVELLETEDPSLQQRASKDILDRVFGKADEKSHSPVISLSAEHVQLLVVAMKESDHGQNGKRSTNGEGSNNSETGEHSDVQEATEG